jgi:hypothetical protein
VRSKQIKFYFLFLLLPCLNPFVLLGVSWCNKVLKLPSTGVEIGILNSLDATKQHSIHIPFRNKNLLNTSLPFILYCTIFFTFSFSIRKDAMRPGKSKYEQLVNYCAFCEQKIYELSFVFEGIQTSWKSRLLCEFILYLDSKPHEKMGKFEKYFHATFSFSICEIIFSTGIQNERERCYGKKIYSK